MARGPIFVDEEAERKLKEQEKRNEKERKRLLKLRQKKYQEAQTALIEEREQLRPREPLPSHAGRRPKTRWAPVEAMPKGYKTPSELQEAERMPRPSKIKRRPPTRWAPVEEMPFWKRPSRLPVSEAMPRPSKMGRQRGGWGDGRGWFEPPEAATGKAPMHAEARKRGEFPPRMFPSQTKTKLDFKKSISSLKSKARRRWGRNLDDLVDRRLDHLARAGEIQKAEEPGKVIVYPTKKERQRGITRPRSITIRQARLRAADEISLIHEGVKYGVIYYRPDTGEIISDKGHPITYEYASRQIVYQVKHPGEPLQYGRGKRTKRIKLPKKTEYMTVAQWIKSASKKVEREMGKVLPEKGKPFQYNGRTIPANPKQKQYPSHRRLGKTYNIKINLRVNQDNISDVMQNIEWYYNMHIDAPLKKIMQAMKRFYGPHWMRAKLNFIMNGTSGEKIEWDEQIPMIGVANYNGFKVDTMYNMRQGFKRLGLDYPVRMDSIELVYIEVTFVTEQAAEHW